MGGMRVRKRGKKVGRSESHRKRVEGKDEKRGVNKKRGRGLRRLTARDKA